MRQDYRLYAFATILCWGAGNACTRMALQDFGAFSLAFWRCGIATLLLFGILWYTHTALPPRRELWRFALAGGAGFFLYNICYNIGYQTITVATGGVISATIPLMTAGLAGIIFGERLSGWQWGCALLQFGGLVWLLGGSFTGNAGVLWVLLSCVCNSIYSLFLRQLSHRYPPLVCAAVSMGFGALFFLPFAPTGMQELSTARLPGILAMLFLGIFASGVAYYLWSKAFSLTAAATDVASFLFFTPLFTAFFGMLLLGEIPDRRLLGSGAVILLGAYGYQHPITVNQKKKMME